MKAFLRRFLCRFLAVGLVALPYAAQTQAALIGVDQALAAQRQAEHGKLASFLARADVQKQLAVLGVSPAAAAERSNALTDDEVQQLAGRIDSLPAGADISAAALLLVLIVILLLFMLDRR
jgi:hypothetical protein